MSARARQDDFRSAMSRLASGVSIVTVREKDEVWGVTISSLVSLSLRPPLVFFSLHGHSRMLARLEAAGAFGISILAASQRALAEALARPDREPIPAAWLSPDCSEAPVIRGALANLAVRETARLTMGDHVGICARMAAAKFSQDAPLVYQLRQYRTVRDIG